MTTTVPSLHTLTRTRRRFVGSAALTMLGAHLGMTGSARAQTTTTTAGALPATKEPTMTTTPPNTTQ